MNHIYPFILFLVLLISCNDPDAPACLKSTGDIQEYTIEVDEFTTLDVHDNIHVTIEQGPVQHIQLTTGENLVNDITFEVVDQNLVIKDLNKCNWAREYGNLNVHIITPTLTKIRSSGGGVISSKGVISFPDRLVLVAELYTADFVFDVDMDRLSIVNNDLSNYYISGIVKRLDVGLYAGDGRFDGSTLMVEHAKLFQRGTNDIIINATQTLTGEIRSTGNIIYCTVPTTIAIDVFDDRGKLIRSCK